MTKVVHQHQVEKQAEQSYGKRLSIIERRLSILEQLAEDFKLRLEEMCKCTKPKELTE